MTLAFVGTVMFLWGITGLGCLLLWAVMPDDKSDLESKIRKLEKRIGRLER